MAQLGPPAATPLTAVRAIAADYIPFLDCMSGRLAINYMKRHRPIGECCTQSPGQSKSVNCNGQAGRNLAAAKRGRRALHTGTTTRTSTFSRGTSPWASWLSGLQQRLNHMLSPASSSNCRLTEFRTAFKKAIEQTSNDNCRREGVKVGRFDEF
jgi:hypothetical protein